MTVILPPVDGPGDTAPPPPVGIDPSVLRELGHLVDHFNTLVNGPIAHLRTSSPGYEKIYEMLVDTKAKYLALVVTIPGQGIEDLQLPAPPEFPL